MAEGNLLTVQMQGVRAFILYKIVRQLSGDIDKVPIDPYTGYERNPHDPAMWMQGDEAQLWADQYGPEYGVGVIISEDITLPSGGRLFCLDIDKCRDGAQWLPHAAAFCERFPGSLVECSVSGNGLHIFGTYFGDRPNHGVKNKDYRIELYTRLRFIAITGVGATGSIAVDQTRALHALAAQFFPPRDEVEYDGDLTTAPVPEWRGPDDDAELLQRMLRSTSARAIFGGKAAFADLWNGNANVLSRVFRAFKNTPWDYSGADLALANHLAFWTGNHGERIERLMRQSALVRDKWDVRPSYLRDTINRACGSQNQWYNDPRSVSAASPPTTLTIPAPPIETTTQTMSAPPAPIDGTVGGAVPPPPENNGRPPIGDYLTLTEQLGLFDGCVYVQDVHQVMSPQGLMLDSSRFDAEYSGYTFAVTADGSRPAKRAWEAFVYSEVFNFPKVRGTFFEPRLPPRTIVTRDGWKFINSFVPIDIVQTRGDASPFVNHLKRILPNGQDAEILLAYFAALVQYPGYKFQWWPLIQGVEGNGKTFISKLMQHAIGRRYTHWPKAGELGSKFNNAFYGKILVCVEDVYISEARGSLWETLKPMITGTELEVEGKGVDKVMREVCFNGILNTNHKNGIRKTMNDRRIGPFFCAQQNKRDLERDGLDKNYFVGPRGFRQWCEGEGGPIVAEFLRSYVIPNEWNPATEAHVAPLTTATDEAVTAGLGAVEQEVLEAIEQGRPGFKNGWVSSTALDILLAQLGKSNAIARNKRRELMEALGYTPHPALPDGRCTTVDTDGNRPRLYVRRDAQGFSETNPATVLQWFQYCQKI